MRRLISIALAAAALSTAPAAAAPRLAPEAQLAKELDGRVAGEPVSCITLHNIRSSRIIDRTESLDSWDVLVTRPFGSQLCNIDVVELYDSSSRMQSGVVFLGEFVPYRKQN